MTANKSSSPNDRITWRQRADLRIVPLEFSGRRSWGVKDPVTLAYFELRDEEYFVLQRLNGQSTTAEICAAFDTQFRPKRLATEELEQFIGQLVSQGLLMADSPGYGGLLVDRATQQQVRRRWSRLGNLFCIKFRGVDPDRLLEWLLNRLHWLFSPIVVAASFLLIVAALTLVIVQFDRVLQRMPQMQALLSPPNLIWLPLLLAIVKILHELGHGLTCKRFGGECRELGVMLLVFTPTLYCNVSDMWMVRDKWKRIAVSAAGMWVEAVIAATCTLLWWFSTPGLFHSLCLNLMFLCSISTLVFNGNPLLRYDGYFVLSDWLEIPNLQQQSQGTIRTGLVRWFCGIGGTANSEAFSRRLFLASYGLASMSYRLILTFLILWSLYYWLQPRGLGVVVQVMAVPMLGLMAFGPMAAATRFFQSKENRRQIDWSLFCFRAALTSLALALLLFIPVPSRVSAEALLDRDTAVPIYATLGGTLEAGVRLGDQVDTGQTIARLDDPRIQSELIRLQGEAEQHQLRLEQLERRRIREPEVAALIPAVREAMRDYKAQSEQLQQAADQLILRAPCDGVILPASWQSGAGSTGSLPTWSGSALDEHNRGCFVKPGTTVCLVGPRESRAAVLLVNQNDINLVRVGQEVRTVWRELAGEVLPGRVTEIAALDLDLLPRDAVQRLNLPARTTARGVVVPVGTWYQVRVELEPTKSPLLRGAAGDAKILVEPQSLGTRIVRWFTRTFAV